jgi:hypothetical protein
MHDWAKQRAVRAADEFMGRDACERDDPGAFFAAVCGKEQLLAVLRATAEPAFMARIGELEEGR